MSIICLKFVEILRINEQIWQLNRDYIDKINVKIILSLTHDLEGESIWLSNRIIRAIRLFILYLMTIQYYSQK